MTEERFKELIKEGVEYSGIKFLSPSNTSILENLLVSVFANHDKHGEEFISVSEEDFITILKKELSGFRRSLPANKFSHLTQFSTDNTLFSHKSSMLKIELIDFFEGLKKLIELEERGNKIHISENYSTEYVDKMIAELNMENLK